ncbi:MAG: hypothetical protein ABIR17_07190 [Pseudolysinimonas sp.]|uniref:hypothetical protein n=1 Tax=Pseudolysinimonas sp. TaxID=2680009 RepID=UPI0032669626
MRFVIAIVAFVIAAASIGLGVAQRTVLVGPDSISSQITTGTASLTIIDGATLNANAGTQAIEIAGKGDIMLAYGRTADVMAWVGDASFNQVSWDADTDKLISTVVQGTDQEVPSPVGSDLWVREFTGTDILTRKLKVPEGVSVIIAADGTLPAPSRLSITWPLDNSAPLSVPLVVAGIIALLVGLITFLWALVHARRRHGPRRASRKLPKRPRPPQLKPGKRRDAGAPDPDPERELEPARPAGRRRAFVATGTLLVGMLALSGCGPATPDPAASSTAAAALDTTPVAVTEGQFAKIFTDVVSAVAAADTARDPDLAATRLAGPALALRVANYAIRGVDSAVAPLSPIPADKIKIVLPQQTQNWPRSVFAVVISTDGSIAPVGLMLTQDSPRENYKVHYLVALIATVPNVAPVELGAGAQAASNVLGVMAPEDVAAAYGGILINGDAAPSFSQFQADGDVLRTAIGPDYKAQRKKQLPTSAAIEFTNGPGPDPVISFVTNDSGQLVAAVLDDVETVTPLESGSAVNPSGQVKALLNKTASTSGITATYGVQLLFYIPPAGSGQQIILLGFASGLVSVTEVG